MTAHKIVKNVSRYAYGAGSIEALGGLLAEIRPTLQSKQNGVVFLVDAFFSSPEHRNTLTALGVGPEERLQFVQTIKEPTTTGLDSLMEDLRDSGHTNPCAVVGMGGGATLDTAKAVANLYTNPGKASYYQGWDLVRNPAVLKIGIPTISGTGAESSRTCVLTNPENGLKLGMNSDYTLYDLLVLDPNLTATVDRNQYFYTGMDSYVHCIESLAGRHRHQISDALSRQVLSLCREVFLSEDMQSPENRQRLMTASYLGGCAIASSIVGLVHPISAGLSVVLGVHHCVANCVTMLALDEFYPNECEEFRLMADAQKVAIPSGLSAEATDQQIAEMSAAASLHEKPLSNALGENFRDVLTPEKLAEIYRRM